MECGGTGKLRLHVPRPRLIEKHEVMHAIGLCGSPDLLQLRQLIIAGRDDELAQPLMADAVLCRIGIEPVTACNAEPRLQAALRIIDAGMYDLRVARARF